MVAPNNIHILVADSDEPSRRQMAEILALHGFRITQAIDGGTAIKVVEERPVDLAIVAQHMQPKSGFDFARHIIVRGHDIGMIMTTDDPTTDLLLEAGKYEISQVMRKPIDPDRLGETVRRVLRAHGKNPDSLTSGAERTYKPEDLMRRAIALAHQNARSRMGGPFGAIVADEQGRIIGEGVNSVTARCDPTAHAEVLAIRRATERKGAVRLDGCAVYCSSEPTMLGQALIIGTGIARVYYGLSHAEGGAVRINEDGIRGEMAKPVVQRTVPYEQLLHDDAMAVYKSWQEQKQKISD